MRGRPKRLPPFLQKSNPNKMKKTTSATKAPKNIVFKFMSDKIAGPSQIIQSRDNARSRLMHKGRPIRYSPNHKSPYIEEQTGEIMRENILFQNGNLVVNESNEALLNFLRVHPQLDVTFRELDRERMAKEDLEELNMEADAMIFAKTADIEVLASALRVITNANVDNMSTAEVRRDALHLAKSDPERLLSIKTDPSFEIQDIARRAVSEGHLMIKGKSVHYNFPDKRDKLLTIPMGEEWAEALERYLISEDGIELYKILKKMLSI
jgi:hypothetical protein